MFCALSGEAPDVPVLSLKSGRVFERRLLETYLSENSKDPINGEEMSIDDVVEIQTSRTIRPRPPSLTSIPALLSCFQTEWDALAVETFQLKQQLQKTRQELSTSLYQHDAACRVIARITKERDEARAALAKVSDNINGGAPTTEKMDVDVDVARVPEDIQEIVTDTMNALLSERKKRKVPEDWTTKEQLSKMKQKKSTAADTKLLKAIPGASDSELVALHPSKKFKAVSDKADKWTINDASSSAELAQFAIESDINCLAFHPDGHLVALGSANSYVYIFHMLTGKVEATFGPADGAITSLSFSENGFWLAVSSQAAPEVTIWHLGKSTVAAKLEVAAETSAVSFDHSGQYLACAGTTGLKIWAYSKPGKEWSVAKEVDGSFSKLLWKESASGLIVGGPNGNLTFTV